MKEGAHFPAGYVARINIPGVTVSVTVTVTVTETVTVTVTVRYTTGAFFSDAGVISRIGAGK